MLTIFATSVYSASQLYTIVVDSVRYGTYDFKTAFVHSPEGDVANLIVADSISGDGYTMPVIVVGNSSFKNKTSLRTVTLPKTVKDIALWAFSGCTNLEQINFSEGLETMQTGTFSNCKSLKEINLPEGLKVVRGFDGCTGLTTVTIPQSVVEIGNGAFSGCNSISSLTLPNNLQKMGHTVFSSCTSLTNITIPSSVTSIGEDAFNGCTNLKSVVMNEGLKSLGDEVFYGCSNLESVNLPNSIETIGISCFLGCAKLTSANIPSALLAVHNYMFSGCTQLATITVPTDSKLETIGDGSFYKTALSSFEFPNTVKSIGKEAFYETQLTSIKIPDNLKIIGERAFSYNTSLVSIDFGEAKIDSVYKLAFSSCTNIETVDIGNLENWLNIGWGKHTYYSDVFYDANPLYYSRKIILDGTQLNVLDIPEGTTEIKGGAFIGCQRFMRLTIPNTLKKIGDYAFSECSDLAAIKFGDSPSLESLGDRAFGGCVCLTNVKLPETVNNIAGAFYGCSGLASFTIPPLVRDLGSSTFYGCTSLTDMEVPEGVTRIGNYAFQNCSKLQSIIIPTTLTSFGHDAFKKCSAMTAVHITDLESWLRIQHFSEITGGTAGVPVNTESVSNPLIMARYLYLNDELVEEITTPPGITKINDYAFKGALSLKKVTISEGVESVGKSAFESCDSINILRLPNSLTFADNYAFGIIRNYTNGERLNVYCDNMEAWTNGCFGSKFTRPYASSERYYLHVNNKPATHLVIPEGITDMGYRPFDNAYNVEKVTLPSTLETIKTSSLSSGQYSMANLKRIYCRSMFAAEGTGIESFNSSDKRIYVPEYCGANYRNKWTLNSSVIYEVPEELVFTDEQTASELAELKEAYRAVYDKEITSMDLTGATLADITTDNLKANDQNNNILYYLPSGTENVSAHNTIIDGYAEKVVLEDKNTFGCPSTFTAGEVSYGRTFTGKKSTLYLPYSLNEAQLEGFTVLEFKGLSSDGNNVVFAKVTSTKPNTPYLIYATDDEGVELGNATNVTIQKTVNTTATAEAQFIGTYDAKVLASDATNTYFVFYDDKFYRVGENVKVNPFRAYICIPVSDSSAKTNTLGLSFEDDIITSIDVNVNTSDEKTVDVYGVDGKLMFKSIDKDKLNNGIYIINNKKVVINK